MQQQPKYIRMSPPSATPASVDTATLRCGVVACRDVWWRGGVWWRAVWRGVEVRRQQRSVRRRQQQQQQTPA
jgi:hypothetical protein